MALTKWSSATLAKAKLHSIWVKITGIPDELMHYKGICEAGSAVGVVQEVDMSSLIKFSLARVKVGVRGPHSVPDSTEITTDPFIYDAYYEVESVVEVGGLLDQDGNVIGLARKESDGLSDDRDPKRNRLENMQTTSVESPVMVDDAEGVGCLDGNKLPSDVEKMIQEELDRRIAAQLHKIEERALAAAMAKIQNMQNKDTSLLADGGTDLDGAIDDEEDFEEEEMNKMQDSEEVDYESSQDLQNRVNMALNGEDPNPKKPKRKTKTPNEDIHLKLRPQGDGTIMDKAKEMASKKNLNPKGTDFCTVLSTPASVLVDMASKINICLGETEE